MVDALPYLVDYPYGCTEQTLNRFLPTVITQRILLNMKLDLKDIQKKRTNLNAQEIGDDKKRAKGWKRYRAQPGLRRGRGAAAWSAAGVQALADMQLLRRRLGLVLRLRRALLAAHHRRRRPRPADRQARTTSPCPPACSNAASTGCKNYQAEQVQLLEERPDQDASRGRSTPTTSTPSSTWSWSTPASNNDDMRDFLYRDRTRSGGLRQGDVRPGPAQAAAGREAGDDPQEHRAVRRRRTTRTRRRTCKLPADNSWWYWYGSEIEADAYYLKLLSRTNPKDEKAARLVKYLLNNRKHATYWNSTRDTAICIEAMAEYLKASGEDKPGHDRRGLARRQEAQGGEDRRRRTCSASTTSFVLTGDAVETGKHTLEIKKQGHRPGLLQRLPDQLHAGGLHHEGRPGSEGQPQVLQADARWTRRSRCPARAARRSTRRSRSTSGRSWPNLADAQERRPGRGRAGDRQQERLRVPAVRGPQGRRLRADAGAQRLQRQRHGRLHGAARRAACASSCRRLRARQAQRQLPHAGRDPGQVQRPADPRLRRCTRRS